MNPFDLPGPPFLVLYGSLLVVVLFGAVSYRKSRETGEPSRLDLSDPYLIAFLRGGPNESLRVAVVNLVDRGLLTADKTKLCRTAKATSSAARNDLERALLDMTGAPVEGANLFNASGLTNVFSSYETLLKDERLLPSLSQKFVRFQLWLLTMGIILGVALTKIMIALDRRHHNIGFLSILMCIGVGISMSVCFPRLTEKGRIALEDLRSLYSRLRDRAADIRPGGATIELAMLAAVFGLTALQGEAFAYSKTLFPRAAQATSSCGSSCGSGGSGCGGGGGGCGGGGGGCGGCGS